MPVITEEVYNDAEMFNTVAMTVGFDISWRIEVRPNESKELEKVNSTVREKCCGMSYDGSYEELENIVLRHAEKLVEDNPGKYCFTVNYMEWKSRKEG